MGVKIEEKKSYDSKDGNYPNPKFNVHPITSRSW